MHASARVRVFLLTAATTVVAIAGITAAIPTQAKKPIALALLATLPNAERQVVPQPAIVTPEPMYSRSEELPASGVLASRDLVEPHSPDEPLLVFTPRGLPLAAEKVVQTAFARPMPQQLKQAIELARLPQAKPAAAWFAPNGAERPSPLLSYARAPSGIEEPFNAVLGGLRSSVAYEAEEDGLHRPRPRPREEVLSAWLQGRSPAQFAPGQHDWVQNPLPATVYAQEQQKCLAEGIYFEARGEPESGQAAVAQVILNRVRNPAYPDTICGVVYQNESRRHKCQFSFACDGRAEIIRSKKAWKVAQRIGSEVTDGTTWLTAVGDSTHYHAGYVRPRWGRRMIKVDKIGEHIFYRTKFGGWS